MNRKIRVPIGNKMVEGEEMNFTILKEDWNEYKLDDGTIIKFKSVVSKIVRTNEYNKEGEPIYYVRSSSVVVAEVPEELKRRG